MKLYIKEMSFPQNLAITKFTNEISKIPSHLAKILVHKSSRVDKHWEKEIENFINMALLYSTNVKTQKGILNANIIKEIYEDHIIKLLSNNIVEIYLHVNYRKQPKITDKSAKEIFMISYSIITPLLIKETNIIVKLFQTKTKTIQEQWDVTKKIKDILINIIMKSKNEILEKLK